MYQVDHLLLQWVPPKKRTKKLSWREVERTQYIDLLYRAYRGLVYYAEWLNARQRLDDMRADMEGGCFGEVMFAAI